MKNLLIAILFALSLLTVPALALTPAERAIVQHIGELNKSLNSDNDALKSKLVWTDNELKHKQVDIDAVAKERDDYKGKYESDHETMMKQRVTVLKLWIALGLTYLAIGGYLFAKFYLHLPI